MSAAQIRSLTRLAALREATCAARVTALRKAIADQTASVAEARAIHANVTTSGNAKIKELLAGAATAQDRGGDTPLRHLQSVLAEIGDVKAKLETLIDAKEQTIARQTKLLAAAFAAYAAAQKRTTKFDTIGAELTRKDEHNRELRDEQGD